MDEAQSDFGQLNATDLKKVLLNIAVFDLPAYLLTMVSVRLGGASWEQAVLQPLPVFIMAFIDLTKKYLDGDMGHLKQVTEYLRHMDD